MKTKICLFLSGGEVRFVSSDQECEVETFDLDEDEEKEEFWDKEREFPFSIY